MITTMHGRATDERPSDTEWARGSKGSAVDGDGKPVRVDCEPSQVDTQRNRDSASDGLPWTRTECLRDHSARARPKSDARDTTEGPMSLQRGDEWNGNLMGSTLTGTGSMGQ